MNRGCSAAWLAAFWMGLNSMAGVNDGLAVYYDFDDAGSGLLPDLSGQGHAGWVQGAAASTGGAIGGAYHFRGVSDYVLVPDLGKFPEGSISFWMNADAVENWRIPLSTSYAGWDACFKFEEAASGDFVVGLAPIAGFVGWFTSNLQARTWYHVMVAWDGAIVRGWLNGRETFAMEHHGRLHTDFRKVAIGNGYSTAPNRFWKGLMDEVRIYNRCLGAAEVETLANKASAREAALAAASAAAKGGRLAVAKAGTDVSASPNSAPARGGSATPKTEAGVIQPAGPAILRIGFSNAAQGEQDVTEFQTGETLFVRVSDVDLPARLDDTTLRMTLKQQREGGAETSTDVELKRDGDAFTGAQPLAEFGPGEISVAVKGLNKRGVFLFRASVLRLHAAAAAP